MSTTNYKLPVIDPASTLSVPDSVNALATSTDNVLHGEELDIKSKTKYVLPPATKTSRGGVIVGSGFKSYANGLVTLATPPYTLPAATSNTLGGVKTGANINNTNGSIAIGNGAFSSTAITTAKLKDGGVGTNDISTGALEAGKIDSAALGYLENCHGAWKTATCRRVFIMPSGSTEFAYPGFYTPPILVYTINSHIKILYVRMSNEPFGNHYSAPSTTYSLYTASDDNIQLISEINKPDFSIDSMPRGKAVQITGGELGSASYRVGTYFPKLGASGQYNGEYYLAQGVLDLAAATFTTASDFVIPSDKQSPYPHSFCCSMIVSLM